MIDEMDADEALKVVYSASDIRAVYRVCRTCKRNALFVVVVLPLLFVILSYRDGDRGVDLVFDALPFFLIGLIVVLGIYFLGPWSAVRLRRKSGWKEPMAFRLTDEGVFMQHPNQNSLFFWSKIQNVVVRGSRLFLFTAPGCAIVLPRASFSSETQFVDWADRAETLWKSATATKSVTVE